MPQTVLVQQRYQHHARIKPCVAATNHMNFIIGQTNSNLESQIAINKNLQKKGKDLKKIEDRGRESASDLPIQNGDYHDAQIR